MPDFTPGERLRIFTAEILAHSDGAARGITAQAELDILAKVAGDMMRYAIIIERALRPPKSPSPNRP